MRRVSICAAIIFALSTLGAVAEDVTAAARAELAPSGKLRVGINSNNSMFVTKGAGEMQGVAFDLGGSSDGGASRPHLRPFGRARWTLLRRCAPSTSITRTCCPVHASWMTALQ